MKNLVIIFTCLVFITACGGGGGDLSPQTAPHINNVILKTQSDFIDSDFGSFVFMVGDEATFKLTATDPDLNMTAIYVNQYLFPDLDTPYFPESELILPTQPGVTTEYFPLDPILVEGPSGDWRICFLIVDSTGLESNDFCVNIKIYEL